MRLQSAELTNTVAKQKIQRLIRFWAEFFSSFLLKKYHLHSTGFPIPKIPGCRTPLGMESGLISNNSITASSQIDLASGPENARLHFKGSFDRFAGWMPKVHEINNHKDWLQVDFGAETQVTQGFYNSDMWVKSYSLRYSNNGSYFEQYQPESLNKVKHRTIYKQ